ncbi:bifunctional folylpolyglutamate synthase/dihydrofolate synthase [Corynebacterium sp. S7]
MADQKSHSDDESIKRILEAIDAGSVSAEDLDFDADEELPEQPNFDIQTTDHGITLNLSRADAGHQAVDDEPDYDDLETETVEPIDRPATEADLAELARVVAELDSRASEREIDPSTEKIAMLMDILGSPQKNFKTIHVSGTNGKTSVVRMISTLFEAFHRRVGYFVSPQLESITDTISIDGAPIHPEDFVRTYDEIKPYISVVDERFDTPLSKFEVLTAIAYAAFADAPVDVAIIEVGMGGAWDATNVIQADVDVIMPVALDHTDFLGSTLGEIASVKAGIITNPDAVVVVAEQEPEAMEAILKRAVETDSAVARFGSEFDVKESSVAVGGQTLTLQGLGGTYEEIFLPLSGAHQASNASVALAAVEAFFGANSEHQLDQNTIRRGFAAVEVPGRLERVSSTPTTFVDSSHNPAGAVALAEALERDFDFTRLIGVVGILEDKDAAGILAALEPVLAEVIVTQPDSPRALDTYELAEIARTIFGDERVHVEEHLPAAVEMARELLDEEEAELGTGIVVTGSVVTAGQARALYGKDS